MKAPARTALLMIVFSTLWGCGPKGAKLQKSVVPPDKQLFETGSEYLRKSQYIKSRLAFQTLINTYPDSELAADSYLTIGDSFYEEGGTENLLQAEDQYKNFIIFFPASPMAADAQLKVVSLNMRMMRTPDRDPTYSYKAEHEAQKFIQQFPTSDYVPIVREYLKEIQENLALGSYGVARFYEDKENIAGARSRYQEIVENYKEFSLMDETYFRLAQTLERSENPDEAAIYYGRIAQGYPDSRFFEAARQRLGELSRPIPEVDPVLAAQHRPSEKPSEGFSPLKPVITFAEALGFKAPPDRYEEAKRAVEAQKGAVAAAASRTAEGAQSGSDILIETTIRKDASGNTQETTVLGGAAGAAKSETGKADSKQPTEKNSKKKGDNNPQ